MLARPPKKSAPTFSNSIQIN